MDERDIMDAVGGDDGAPFGGMPGLGGVNFAAGGPRDQLAPVVPAQDPKELELANARREYARALQALVRRRASAVACVLRSAVPALFARPTSSQHPSAWLCVRRAASYQQLEIKVPSDE